MFAKAGVEVTTAAPLGGIAPLDQASAEAFSKDESAVAFLRSHKDVWEKTVKLSTLDDSAADRYDAIFWAGGHGPMFDLPHDKDSQRLAAAFAAKGKVVSAVCHGSGVLAYVKGSDGKPLLAGRQVTGFSNAEEDAAGKKKWMPFLVEDALNEASGGKYVKADEPWGVKVVTDGNIITGQNPASSRAVGEAVVKAIKA